MGREAQGKSTQGQYVETLQRRCERKRREGSGKRGKERGERREQKVGKLIRGESGSKCTPRLSR
jgi:hypothetical protein